MHKGTEMEKDIPGWEGNYKVVITDTDCYCINKYGKKLHKVVYGDVVKWKFHDGNMVYSMKAEEIMDQTFPELTRDDYYLKLFHGVKNTTCIRTRRRDIDDGIFLEILYTARSYCLTTPPDLNLEKEIKTMFPGPIINIETGTIEARRREIYFVTDDYNAVVVEKIKKNLKKNS